jgi:hypothetical protein
MENGSDCQGRLQRFSAGAFMSRCDALKLMKISREEMKSTKLNATPSKLTVLNLSVLIQAHISCSPIMGTVIPINEQSATDLSPRHFFKSGYDNN